MTAVEPRRGLSVVSLVVFLGLAAAAGCTASETPAPAKGKVVPKCRILRNGVPLKPTARNLPPGDSGFRLIFVKIGTEEVGKQISAIILTEEPGTFELLGQDAKAIPPGKYRVAVVLGPEGGKDELKGKYSPETSPIEVEVKEGEDLIVDLANYP